MWDLDVEDDLGTDYDVPSGAYSGEEEQIQGDRDVRPAAPSNARTLTLIVYDVTGATDHIERGRTAVSLS
jgi:hypothetical protein